MLSKSTSQPTQIVGEVSTIGSSMNMEGELKTTGDIRIDGTVKGNISTTARLVIGTSGKVEGTVKCKSAEIFGKLDGKLEVTELLTLKQSAFVKGEVSLGKLSVEPGAIFDVVCKMITKENSQQPVTEKK